MLMAVTAPRHPRPGLGEFLTDDPRQVWARGARGEPVFMAEGAAEVLREQVKTRWRCPTPGCTVPLTSVGGSRRHHWKHDGPAAHTSSGESRNHLQAKAMLAFWAARQDPRCVVVEEQATTKDPATSRSRRADVMVTWPQGRRVAFEVEYKPYPVEAWALKQGDYDTHPDGPIGCVWLLGHTKFTRVQSGAYGTGTDLVRISLLGQRILATGRPLLVVNPSLRLVGTVVSAYTDTIGPRRVDASDSDGRIQLDPLDACRLDPIRGMVTPTMDEVDRAEVDRHSRRKADAIKRRDDALRKRTALETRDALVASLQEAWETSEIRNRLLTRWGTVHDLIAKDLGFSEGVWAHPAHWHAAIYEELLHDKPAGTRFTFNDITRALDRHSINTRTDRRRMFAAVMGFLERLAKAQVVTIHRSNDGRVTHFAATGHNIEDPAQMEKQRAAAASAKFAAELAEWRRLAELERNQRAAERRRETHFVDVERARLDQQIAAEASAEQREAAWESSPAHQTLVDCFGSIPPAISWPGTLAHLAPVSATKPHWHALIYLAHIHHQPGNQFTTRDAFDTLEAAQLDFPHGHPAAFQEVQHYLEHLPQRGILQRPDSGRPKENHIVAAPVACRHPLT